MVLERDAALYRISERFDETPVSILVMVVVEAQLAGAVLAAAAEHDGLGPCSAEPIPSLRWVGCPLPSQQIP